MAVRSFMGVYKAPVLKSAALESDKNRNYQDSASIRFRL